MGEHTTVKLARALAAIPGVPEGMIQRAIAGYYHDYLSPLTFPELQLIADLRELASSPQTPAASRPLLRAMAQRVIDGEYDASKEESDAWAASPEGQATFRELAGGRDSWYGEPAVRMEYGQVTGRSLGPCPHDPHCDLYQCQGPGR